MLTVSVIMPSFNSEKHIKEAIKSILNQSFIDFELIVVDGGSTDNTVKIIQDLSKKDKRIVYIDNIDDQGPAHARYIGIKKSKGEYIAFLDADDFWLNSKLEKQTDFMKLKEISFCYTSYRSINESGKILSCLIPMYKKYDFTQALGRRGIGTLTVIVKRSLLTDDVIGHYGKSHGEEYLWWLLILKQGVRAKHLNIDSARYRNTDDSLSTHRYNHQLTVWHSYRNEVGLSLLPAIYYYSSYIIDVLIRRTWVVLCTKFFKPVV